VKWKLRGGVLSCGFSLAHVRIFETIEGVFEPARTSANSTVTPLGILMELTTASQLQSQLILLRRTNTRIKILLRNDGFKCRFMQ
jgi:hypothetical protein